MSDTTLCSELTNLMNGAWQIVKVADAGKDVTNDETEDEESSHFLWFNEEIIVSGNEWAAWDMPYKIQCDRLPMEIDIIREDLQESWLQKCIFELTDDTLLLCGAGSVVLPRPSDFSSSLANQQMLYVAKRCNEPQPS